jgi:hypothetical protein
MPEGDFISQENGIGFEKEVFCSVEIIPKASFFGIARLTPSLPRGGGIPRGQAPKTPGFNHPFSGAH